MKEKDFETQLRSIASGMGYPPTPNIAGSVAARLRAQTRPRRKSRTFARLLVIALVLLASLMLIPPVRAAVVELIQIGIVRVFRAEPAPAPDQVPATATPLTATSRPTLPALIPLLEELAGESSLAEVVIKHGEWMAAASQPWRSDLCSPSATGHLAQLLQSAASPLPAGVLGPAVHAVAARW